jgi:tRNA pseudouridine13 synthase
MDSLIFRPAGEAERKLGLEYFYTDVDGIGGRLRAAPQDFVVEEVSEKLEPVEGGRFTAAVIRSTNWETNRLVRKLSKRLGIGRNRIMFAGTKDKRAVTTQLMIFAAPLGDVNALDIIDIEVLEAFTTNRSIFIGDLYGNRFSIAVRGLDLESAQAKEQCQTIWDHLDTLGGFPNFFGVQRFGVVRPITHLIGRHIVNGEPDMAVKAYLCATGELEDEGTTAARTRLADSWEIHKALAEYPHTLSFERVLLNHLAKKPDDHVGALSRLPQNLLTMFVHAYQSCIFNRILSRRMETGLPLNEPVEGDRVLKMDKYGLPAHDDWLKADSRNIPKLADLCKKKKAFVSATLYGYESEFAEGEPGEIEASVIDEEGVTGKDYLLPEFRNMDMKGTRREVLAPVKGFDLRTEDDAIRFDFELTKGCYATTLMREFMKRDCLDGY